MTRSTLGPLTFAAALLATALSLHSQQQSFGDRSQGKPAAIRRQFVGGGGWQSRGRAHRQSWQVQLKQLEDDSLAGRVVIVGSPVLDHAQITRQVTGSEVDGVLLDDSGRQVGTFSGAMTNSALAGTYTHRGRGCGQLELGGQFPNGIIESSDH